MKKKALWISIGIVFCLVLLIGFDFIPPISETPPVTTTQVTTVITDPPLPENPIDFAVWQERNPDVHGWIRVENTNINYPILQHAADSLYYLRRDIDGNINPAGEVFTQHYNSINFTDRVTLIYGHNVSRGDRKFHQLHRFANERFFERNDTMYIYRPGYIMRYTIYSAFEFDDRHIMYSFAFGDNDRFQEFIDITKNPASTIRNVREGVEVTTSDRLIVLSTCTMHRPSRRYLVVGVLIEYEKTL